MIAHYSGDTNFAAAEGGTSPVSASPGVLSSPVNNGGFFEVPMVNPNYSAVTGTVTVSLSGAAGSAGDAAALASGKFKLGRFATGKLRLKLSHSGLLKLRAKHKLRVTVKVSTNDAGKLAVHTSHLTLRLKKH